MPALNVLRAPAGCFRDLRFVGGMLGIVLSMQDQREICLSHGTQSRVQLDARSFGWRDAAQVDESLVS